MNPCRASRWLVGQKFGKITVRKFAYRNKSDKYWWGECECGTVRRYSTNSLVTGKVKSCGRGVCNNAYKHGYTLKSKKYPAEYNLWHGMKKRCCNPTNKDYPRYGGRGIRVCDRWLRSFAKFKSDMGDRPSPLHSIDRKDNDGDYTPENCHWATRSEQARNERRNVWIEHNGRRMVQADWASELGCTSACISHRKELGWSDEKIVTTPIERRGTRCRTHAN